MAAVDPGSCRIRKNQIAGRRGDEWSTPSRRVDSDTFERRDRRHSRARWLHHRQETPSITRRLTPSSGSRSLSPAQALRQRQLCRLPDKTPAFTLRESSRGSQDFVLHERVLDIMDLTLLPWCENYQLNSNSDHGDRAGRDTATAASRRFALSLAHPRERNATPTVFWALSDFREENGRHANHPEATSGRSTGCRGRRDLRRDQ